MTACCSAGALCPRRHAELCFRHSRISFLSWRACRGLYLSSLPLRVTIQKTLGITKGCQEGRQLCSLSRMITYALKQGVQQVHF